MFFEYFISSRYLFLGKREGFLSVIAWFSFIGIALGVGTLIVVMSVMNGFRHELFGALVSMRGHVSVHQIGQPMAKDTSLLHTLQQVPGIRLAYPMLEQQAIVMNKQQAQGVMVQGFDESAINERNRIQVKVDNKEGSAPLSRDSVIALFKDNNVFIGRRLAESLDIKVGDSISLLTPKPTVTAFGSLPRQKTFKVAGLFHVGMRDFDRNFIFMPMQQAQHFFKYENQWTQIDIFSVHDDLSTQLTNVVQQVLNANPQTQKLHAFDWRHSDASIFHAVKMERNVMFLILTLIILIASFNIITGLTMMVKDKVKDIAILRTMGCSRRSILLIFIMTGSFIGVVGTFLGLVLGLSFAVNIENIRQFLQSFTGATLFSEEIYFLSTLPVHVDKTEIIIIACTSLLLSFLATIYPSWRASTMDPVEGIKSV